MKKSNDHETLRAQRFELINENGKTLGFLTSKFPESVSLFGDSAVKAEDDFPSVFLGDPKSGPFIAAGQSVDGEFQVITATDADGEPRFRFMRIWGKHYFSVFGSNGEELLNVSG